MRINKVIVMTLLLVSLSLPVTGLSMRTGENVYNQVSEMLGI